MLVASGWSLVGSDRVVVCWEREGGRCLRAIGCSLAGIESVVVGREREGGRALRARGWSLAGIVLRGVLLVAWCMACGACAGIHGATINTVLLQLDPLDTILIDL